MGYDDPYGTDGSKLRCKATTRTQISCLQRVLQSRARRVADIALPEIPDAEFYISLSLNLNVYSKSPKNGAMMTQTTVLMAYGTAGSGSRCITGKVPQISCLHTLHVTEKRPIASPILQYGDSGCKMLYGEDIFLNYFLKSNIHS